MRASDTDRVINEIASTHHGLVTRSELIARGVHPRAIENRVATGRIERVDRGVFRVAGAPPTWHQRALTHCIAAGPDAVLSHRAAAMAWNLRGYPTAPYELLVDRHTRRTKRPNTILHESLTLADIDRSVVNGIPVSSAVRTLLDLPAVSPWPKVDDAFDDALANKLCTVDQIVNRFVQVARRGRPGTKIMRRLLEKRAGYYIPTMSTFEHRLLPLIERADLPTPVRQFPVPLRGTTVYLDFGWPQVRFAVECDGLFFHGRDTRLPWDDDRQNELVLLGWTMQRHTWHSVHNTPEVVIQQLRDGYALARDLTRLAHPA